ncbi:type II secretion system protein E [candidate division KSB3 bacterium]|uniref:Type II secretion system protein E n=1 Tax=candidate division KSB3 bacterium TaxID=2044937 RepID=A0A2G6E9S4_9BACT|nr:MAG: type II secretion system protein E [candidate division KSB3 bacterium]PIE30875.1 MAG: type II secretion system protein E [candidate division KSB3 bacterium]
MASNTFDADFVCSVLRENDLLGQEQEQEILIQKDKHQKLLQSRLLKESHNNSRVKSSKNWLVEEVTVVDVISSMHLRLPRSKEDILTEELIMKTLATHWGLPFTRLDPLKLDMETVTSKLSEPFAVKHLIVPIHSDEEHELLTVAVMNPWDIEALETVRRVSGMKVKPVISTKTDILKIVKEFHGFRTSVKAAEEDLGGRIDFGNLEQYTDVNIRYTDKHIVNAVNLLFNYAFEQRASDIHIEPKREYSQIRLRIDGLLHNIHRMPKSVNAAIISRIKMLSRMDIAEKRRPQDGRIKTRFHGRDIELRVSTMPVAYDEKVVIRVLDRGTLVQNIEELGFSEAEAEQYMSFIAKSNGIILITGPTGSGKTTTLYSTLEKLSTEQINVMTIEDPIEMLNEHLNQIAVRANVGLTFGTALRNIVRQDPDVIMVGEIRDTETVDNAIHAALTGHLVLSTLHTNDAPSAIARLVDMGAEPFLVESTLIAVLAQRLVRKVCDNCGAACKPSSTELAALKLAADPSMRGVLLQKGEGCGKCRGTGYYGRSAIFEVMPVSPKIRALIHNNAGAHDIKEEALKEGMQTLRESAIRKMKEGITTVEEVIRVTGTIV